MVARWSRGPVRSGYTGGTTAVSLCGMRVLGLVGPTSSMRLCGVCRCRICRTGCMCCLSWSTPYGLSVCGLELKPGEIFRLSNGGRESRSRWMRRACMSMRRACIWIRVDGWLCMRCAWKSMRHAWKSMRGASIRCPCAVHASAWMPSQKRLMPRWTYPAGHQR